MNRGDVSNFRQVSNIVREIHMHTKIEISVRAGTDDGGEMIHHICVRSDKVVDVGRAANVARNNGETRVRWNVWCRFANIEEH